MNHPLLKAIVRPLLSWYSENARVLPWRENRDPYRIWVSEIMLQQTRVEAAKLYFVRFLEAAPTVEALAALSEDALLKLWEGLGYYTRARNLQKAARVIVAQHGGALPGDYGTLLTLPGIGEYTAGAIASIAFEEPVAAVDGNVLRVLARLQNDCRDTTTLTFKREMKAALEAVYPPRGERGAFTQSLMELGAMLCLPNTTPHCGECPLSACCLGYQQGTAQLLPTKQKKAPRRQEQWTVFLIACGTKIAVGQRLKTGLLSGMWELPNLPGQVTEAAAAHWLEESGFFVEELLPLAGYRHVFTHVEWEVSGFFVRVLETVEGFVWVDRQERMTRISLPTAFSKLLENLPEF